MPQSVPFERLMSPIPLADSCLARPPPTSTSSRRRSKPTTRSVRRRRVNPRVESRPTHSFDDLPWISTLDAAPELINPWDIADLSIIPDSHISSSGLGPVRSRKSSLRSSPIASISNLSPSPPLPLRDTSLFPPSNVSTPRSRFMPSRVLFHNLMPVSYDSRPEQPRPCITSSHINF
ncbi:hypothetical protein JR316_0003482 [Psilocybe cubensis]|uniref:Uncharacterized protein n=2 Tax=Psilocybe cubensis TaxID=181762 RepID=A0A8H7Y521_PSICU|nr:hypothetical protein JR316_0003482 [Psilocybe cubensis]KAH9484003.1 hypothetical protein JR316_0003482 [Psilocybe cubensis]